MGEPNLKKFNSEVYSDALSEVLQSMAEEDMAEHGRLLCMKEVLTDISGNSRLNDNQLSMFYIKDIDAQREGQGKTTAKDLTENPPSE